MIKKQITVMVETALTMEINMDESQLEENATLKENIDDITQSIISEMDYNFTINNDDESLADNGYNVSLIKTEIVESDITAITDIK